MASGAPAQSPSPARALRVLDGLTGHQVIAVILGAFVVSVATHPLQIPLIQIVEGYWWGLPFGRRISNYAIKRFKNELAIALRDFAASAPRARLDWNARNLASDAQFRLDWLPENEVDLRPTVLGNTLWRGETRAGQSYGLELDVALPRLIPLMSPSILAELNDRRNQLDAAVRLCVATGIATAVSVGLLLLHGPWLFLAVADYLLCWACYKAAVAAAHGFSTSLAAAVDLYHLQFFDALSIKRPVDIDQECEYNSVLMDHFRGLDSEASTIILRYIASKAKEGADEAAATADSEPL